MQTGAQIDKVLLFDYSGIITDVSVGMENALVQGKVTAVVTYLTENEIKTENFSIQFSEEVEADGLAIGQKVIPSVECHNGKIVLGGEEGDNSLGIEISAEISVSVYATQEIEAVKDAYSTEVELNLQKEQIKQTLLCDNKSFTGKVNGSVSFDEGMLPVRQLIGAVSYKNNIAAVNYVEADGKLSIEGLVTANILYRDENGINSVEANLPYSESFDCKIDCNVSYIKALGVVVGAYTKSRRDREIDVTVELCFATNIFCESIESVLVGIEEGEAKEQNKSAVSVFIAEEGEGIWEVAKALSARPDQIYAQNPNLEMPFKGGERVIFYRQLL